MFTLPRTAIVMVASLIPFGLLVFGPDCSSWTVISRGSSWRSVVNPRGREGLAWVQGADLMISRWLGCKLNDIYIYIFAPAACNRNISCVSAWFEVIYPSKSNMYCQVLPSTSSVPSSLLLLRHGAASGKWKSSSPSSEDGGICKSDFFCILISMITFENMEPTVSLDKHESSSFGWINLGLDGPGI